MTGGTFPDRPPYLPGYGDRMLTMVRARRAERQAAFTLPLLRRGMDVLDIGCGPGAITVGLALRVAPGCVTGLDVEPSQIEEARASAGGDLPTTDVRFLVGSAYELPFADASFDVVFSHALLEHLARPAEAVAEMRRVLRPGGIVALRSSDWGHALVEPREPALLAALAAHVDARRATGADPDVGARLPEMLEEAGFRTITATERHDEDLPIEAMAAYIAERLAEAATTAAEAAQAREHAAALRTWAQLPGALLLTHWVEVTATR